MRHPQAPGRGGQEATAPTKNERTTPTPPAHAHAPRPSERTLAETFNLKTIEFGKSVPHRERRRFMRALTSALHELATTLGCDARDLGFGHTLGIAFGAHGRGGRGAAAAHYDPHKALIALTRRRGTAMIAHEWCHALDHALGTTVLDRSCTYDRHRQIRHNATLMLTIIVKTPYASQCAKANAGGPAGALAQIARTAGTSAMAQRARALDTVERRTYWTQPTELLARSFEGWLSGEREHAMQRESTLIAYPDTTQWAAKAGAQRTGHYPWPLPGERMQDAQLWRALFATREWITAAARARVRRARLHAPPPAPPAPASRP